MVVGGRDGDRVKTSINIPDQLHAQVQDLAPELPFGELVRDALVLALPQWQLEVTGGAGVLALHVRVRAAEAAAALAGGETIRRQRKPRVNPRPAAPAVPAPDAPPARRKATARKSATTAATDYDRSESRSTKPGRSRRS